MSFSEKSIALPYDAVKVVANPTCSPNEINKDETFITHSNRQYGKPIQFDVSEQAFGDPKRPSRTIKDGRGFNVSFQRTPRMPDDNKLHQLPGTLGSYDLFNVEAYAERLPQNIRDVGGVFLPMWQREAMWVNFEMGTNQWATKYAVRVFVGRVNAVSGLLMDEDPISKDSGGQQQDYIVIPGQRWLDGICVAPGIVRQFVAMPCEPSSSYCYFIKTYRSQWVPDIPLRDKRHPKKSTGAYKSKLSLSYRIGYADGHETLTIT